ncbi:hypothetical protein [Streptacidiphilus sp. PAMC 29251]
MSDQSNGARIPDDYTIIRMIKPDWRMPEDGVLRPTSQAMADSSDDGAMSTFISEDIFAAGRLIKELSELPKFAGHFPCIWLAGELRGLGQEIERDPIDEFPGHALVRDSKGSRGSKARRRLAKASRWIEE